MNDLSYPEISQWLENHYGLPTPEIHLLREYTNRVYRVITAQQQYVWKVYGHRWRSAQEIHYEVDLLNHLEKEKLPVAKPIPAIDGAVVKQVKTPLGEHLAVLFEYVDGVKPQPPFSPELYSLFGQAIGSMHEYSHHFSSRHARQKIDLAYLLDQPLRLILPLLEQQPDGAAYVQRLRQRIKTKMDALEPAGLDWGPIHGDASLDNLHRIEDTVILYDFDSGGPGWRASDLQGWAVGFPAYQQQYAAFLNGYRRIRPLHEQDIEASWFLTLAWDIWGMRVDLERRVQKMGRAAVSQYLCEKIALLRERERFLP